jgi:hypothetical protein
MAAVGLVIVSASFVLAQVIRPASFTPRLDFEATVAKIPGEPSCDCWWPHGAQSTAFNNKMPVFAGDRNVDLIEWTSKTRSFNVSGGETSTVRVATFYYPNWHATVNGEPAPLTSSSDGVITVTLPSYPSEVRISFVEDRYVIYTELISAATLIFLLMAAAASVASGSRSARWTT